MCKSEFTCHLRNLLPSKNMPYTIHFPGVPISSKRYQFRQNGPNFVKTVPNSSKRSQFRQNGPKFVKTVPNSSKRSQIRQNGPNFIKTVPISLCACWQWLPIDQVKQPFSHTIGSPISLPKKLYMYLEKISRSYSKNFVYIIQSTTSTVIAKTFAIGKKKLKI